MNKTQTYKISKENNEKKSIFYKWCVFRLVLNKNFEMVQILETSDIHFSQ